MLDLALWRPLCPSLCGWMHFSHSGPSSDLRSLQGTLSLEKLKGDSHARGGAFAKTKVHIQFLCDASFDRQI